MSLEKFNVEITADASGLKKAAREGSKSVKVLSDDVKNEIKSMIKEWDRLQKELTSTQKAWGFDKEISGSMTEGIQKSIDDLKKALNNFVADIPAAMLDDLGFDFDFSQLAQPIDESKKSEDELGQSILDNVFKANTLKEKFKLTRDAINDMLKTYNIFNTNKNGFVGMGTFDYSKASPEGLIEAYKKLNEILGALNNTEVGTNRWIKGINYVKKEIYDTLPPLKQLQISMSELWGDISPAIGKTFSALYKGAKGIGTAFKKVIDYLSKIKDKWFNLGKNNDFFNSIKRAGMALLGIRGIFTLIRRSMNAYLSQNEELQNKLNSIWYALGSLFAPALEVLINILARIISLVNTLAKALGFAGINMKKLGSAGSSAAKQLAPFDEINNLTEQSGGGTDYDFSWLEDRKVPGVEALNNLLDKLIAKLPQFNELMIKAGETVNKFSDYLLKAFTYVDENGVSIKEKVSTLATGFADGLNTLIETIDWTQLGQAIGAGLDLFITGLHDVIYGIDWKNLGSSLAEGANEMIEMIDFKTLGELLLGGFNSIFEGLSGFLNTLNWKQLGDKIVKGINGAIDSLNAEDISSTLNSLLVDLPKTLGKVLRDANWEQLGQTLGECISGLNLSQIISNAFTTLTDFSGSVSEAITGILKKVDLADAVSDIITGLLDSAISVITQPKSSMKMLEVAATLISSLVAAIVTFIPKAVLKIGDLIYNGLIKNDWSTTGEEWAEAFGSLGDSIAQPWINAFNTMDDTFNNTFTDLDNKSYETTNSVKTAFTDMVNRLSESATSVETRTDTMKNSMATNLAAIRDNVVSKWEEIKNNTSSKWEEIKLNVSNKVSEIKDNVNTRWNELKLNTSETFENIKNTFSSKWETIKGVFKSASNSLTTTWQSFKATFLNIWEGIKNGIKSPINAIIGFINSLISGVCRGINAVVDALNKLSFTVPNNILTRWAGIAGATFGINISHISTPQIPKLAKGGVVDEATLAMVGEQGREIVAPDNLLRQIVNEGNEETNILLSDVLKAINSINLSPYVTVKDIGAASVKYINNQTRVLGGAII